MRLSQEQKNAIEEVLGRHCAEPGTEVWLFGSRVDDQLKGGDIDLAWLLPTASLKEAMQRISHQVLAQIKSDHRIGDRRIDLKIIHTSDVGDEFFKIALNQSRLIRRWE